MPPTPKGLSMSWPGAAPKPSSETENAAALTFPMVVLFLGCNRSPTRRNETAIADMAVASYCRAASLLLFAESRLDLLPVLREQIGRILSGRNAETGPVIDDVAELIEQRSPIQLAVPQPS